MSGPIVRTGATPEFSQGWDRIFGKRAGAASSSDKHLTAKSAAKKTVQSAKAAASKVAKAVKGKKSGRK